MELGIELVTNKMECVYNLTGNKELMTAGQFCLMSICDTLMIYLLIGRQSIPEFVC